MRGPVGLFLTCFVAALALAEEPPMQLVGSAELRKGVLRLTPSKRQQVGAAWRSVKQQVVAGFEVEFEFQITGGRGLGRGADGFAFVLQNEGPGAIAGRGSAGGFAVGDGRQDQSKAGIPRSVAVFFDTFRNSDGGDPSDNYIGICTNGPVESMRWPPRRLASTKSLKVRLKDGRVHRARVRFAPPIMSVFIDDDDRPVLQAVVDLRTVIDSEGLAWAGFTASTGNGYQNHDILRWRVTSAESLITNVDSRIAYALADCMEGRNLCTPAHALVEQQDGGRYRIVLPAHIGWAAGIPNPTNPAVVVQNARGYVCLDPAAPDTCNGAGSSLVLQTEKGVTSFGVKGWTKAHSRTAEGFLEFEVTLK
ncbi:MAG TPA: L-type lectin-domain containing protein [Bryobacteraceae bacterium]|nr:L-type lectin-domain containing protein [Bryobacteraceae bacterium]